MTKNIVCPPSNKFTWWTSIAPKLFAIVSILSHIYWWGNVRWTYWSLDPYFYYLYVHNNDFLYAISFFLFRYSTIAFFIISQCQYSHSIRIYWVGECPLRINHVALIGNDRCTAEQLLFRSDLNLPYSLYLLYFKECRMFFHVHQIVAHRHWKCK